MKQPYKCQLILAKWNIPKTKIIHTIHDINEFNWPNAAEILDQNHMTVKCWQQQQQQSQQKEAKHCETNGTVPAY